MDALFQLCILLAVAGLGWWAFTTILASVPLPPPVRAILTVIAVLMICAFLFRAFGLWRFPTFLTR